jgi:putative endopeptidase
MSKRVGRRDGFSLVGRLIDGIFKTIAIVYRSRFMKLSRAILPMFLAAVFLARGEDVPPVRFSIEHMDLSVDPGADFYRYASGYWIKNTPIPADQSEWVSFVMVDKRNWQLLHEIMNSAATATTNKNFKPTATNLNERLVGEFYRSAMDTNRLEKLKFKPVDEDLRRVDGAGSVEELIKVLAHLKLSGASGGAFFDASIEPDEKNTAIYTLAFSQGGLGLPEREYYLADSFAREREAYLKLIKDLESLAGLGKDKAGVNARTILDFETALAKASRAAADLRDPVANYNKLKTAEAVAQYPNLHLKTFLKESGRPDVSEIVVRQTNFFAALDKALHDRPLEDLKMYLHWSVLRAAAPYLHAAAEKEVFDLYGTMLGGATEQEPRWQRSGRVIDEKIGEALGKLFVDKHFPPEAKKRMAELVANLREVFKSRLEKVDWMTEATRQKALAKFARFTPKIGYPDKFRDYSAVKIRADDFLGNVRKASEFEQKRNWARIGKAVDRSEWGMTPPTVNAYFNPPQNEIVFPAGILQPPFFDLEADDAVNYGAIGFVIGHEITHGFDDQGRQYDADGNLKDWWSEADAKEFLKRAEGLEKQFNQYEPLPGMHVNGKLTLGENIADLGGLSIAYEALERALAKEPSKRKMIDGFTPEQRFFLSAAQVWKANIREPLLKQLITANPHSPPAYRVLGPLGNLPEFYEAFQIKTNAPMFRAPAERIKIW